MKNKPLISVILPVCNSQNSLSECLKSIRSQTYKNLEVIAIDDRSTDKSFKILKLFGKRYKKFRVYKNKKRYGLAVTLNRCFKKAKGEYIALADANSKCYLQRFKRQLSFLVSNPKVAVVGSQEIILNSKGRRIKKTEFPPDHASIYKNMLTGPSIAFETVMIDKKILPKDIFEIKKIPGNFLYIDLFMKIAQYGELANLSYPLNYKKEEPKSYFNLISGNKQISFIKQAMKYITLYDWRPSLKSFFLPSVKPV